MTTKRRNQYNISNFDIAALYIEPKRKEKSTNEATLYLGARRAAATTTTTATY